MTEIHRTYILKQLLKDDFDIVLAKKSKFKSKAAHKALNNLLYILTKTRNLL